MMIVDDGRVEPVGQGETVDPLAVEIIDLRAAVDDVLAVDHEHQHEIDAVAMDAFRRGLALGGQFRVDAELVRLDMPMGVWRQASENAAAEAQDRGHRRAAQNMGLDRLVMARDAAVQIVVAQALIVRLVRLHIDDVARRQGPQGGVPARAIAAAIGHIFVARQIVPAVLEGLHIRHRLDGAVGQVLLHPFGRNETPVLAGEKIAEAINGHVRRGDMAFVQ